MGRLSSSEALLGPQLFAKVRDTPILVVGAGGIGCELLKNLVLVGFSNIEIIDLDTIDLSNLNRQFLFRKADIKKSKSLVAAEAARHFNPSSGIKIHARHGNVKEAENDIEWIGKFGLVMNALDNLDARRHVNKLCQAAKVPLIESGTAGYLGQAVPIINGVTECFDCIPKPAPKSFPVCTIRSTPSEPIHCIVWGKNYLFGKLFGEDDEAGDEAELNAAKDSGENAEEIENLKKEAAAFRQVRGMLGEADGAQRVFRKVFHEDIERILAMEDMWKVAGRVKPVPLDDHKILDGTFVVPPPRVSAAPAANGTNGSATNGVAPVALTANAAPTLKDQKELSCKENLELFIDSCQRLAARAIAHPDIPLAFDKDDDDTLDFVLAVANLRAIAYGIPTRTRFQVKEMAGNIIPAIATTNAVIAGLIVMQAIKLLQGNVTEPRAAFLGAIPQRPLGTINQSEPSAACAVCRDEYIPFKVDLSKCTLGEFVNDVVGGWLAPSLGDDFESSILEGGRVLADPDFDDNHSRTLADLGIERGKMITVMDEDDKFRPFHFCVLEPVADATASFTLPETPPTLPTRPKAAAAAEREPSSEPEILDAPPPKATKRPAPEDGDEPTAKKAKVAKVADDDDIILVE